jgi:hypothetical protein
LGEVKGLIGRAGDVNANYEEKKQSGRYRTCLGSR